MESTSIIILFLAIIVLYLLIGALSFVSYILTSLSLYRVAANRGINHAWLAWLPIGSDWILGSICDYHDYYEGKPRKWRAVLLTLSLLVIGLVIAVYIALIVFIGSIAFSFSGSAAQEPPVSYMLSMLIPMYVVLFIAAFAAAALSVVQAVCIFKFFDALAPKKAIKYLLLWAIVPLAGPICMYKCKDSLLGIPQFEPVPVASNVSDAAPVLEAQPTEVAEEEAAENAEDTASEE